MLVTARFLLARSELAGDVGEIAGETRHATALFLQLVDLSLELAIELIGLAANLVQLRFELLAAGRAAARDSLRSGSADRTP